MDPDEFSAAWWVIALVCTALAIAWAALIASGAVR